MENRTLYLLLAVVIGAMLLLIGVNTASRFSGSTPAKYLSHNEVKGMAIIHNGKEYTLNFDQQNAVASILNRSVKIGLEGYLIGEEADFGYEALVVYRFNQPDISIKPVGFANQQLIFQARAFNPDGLMRETGPGEMHQLLSDTFDKAPPDA